MESMEEYSAPCASPSTEDHRRHPGDALLGSRAPCAPTPALTAGCPSATSTSTARRGKRPTLATAAQIALVGSNWNFQGDRPCPECEGTGWVPYRSEKTSTADLRKPRSVSRRPRAALLHRGGVSGRPLPRPATRALRGRLLLQGAHRSPP